MDAVYLAILKMSIAVVWLILAVIVLRFLLKKAPKWLPCVLWALVAVRLVCPFSIESPLSLIPSDAVSSEAVEEWCGRYTGALSIIPEGNAAYSAAVEGGYGNLIQGTDGKNYVVTGPDGVSQPSTMLDTSQRIWLIGMAFMLVSAAVSFLRLRKKVKISFNICNNIWLCDDIKTPFILGIIKPRIYLPSGMEEAQQTHVIAHENAHLKRRDHWWKPLGYMLLTVYWFNPLCWLAYYLFCRDIELACDEKVVRKMKKDDVIAYSEALLSCSVAHRPATACPLSFGEVGVKERIKRVLNYKKPTLWLIAAAVIACIVVAVCFLTNPSSIGKDGRTPHDTGHLETTEADGGEYIPLIFISSITDAASLDIGLEVYDLNSDSTRYVNAGLNLRDAENGWLPNISLHGYFDTVYILDGTGRADGKVYDAVMDVLHDCTENFETDAQVILERYGWSAEQKTLYINGAAVNES